MEALSTINKNSALFDREQLMLKSCKIACAIVEQTERFLVAINKLQKSIKTEGYNVQNVAHDLQPLVVQFDNLNLIFSVMEQIVPIDLYEKSKVLSASASAAVNACTNSLSRLFDQIMVAQERLDPSVAPNKTHLQNELQNLRQKLLKDKNSYNGFSSITPEATPPPTVVDAANNSKGLCTAKRDVFVPPVKPAHSSPAADIAADTTDISTDGANADAPATFKQIHTEPPAKQKLQPMNSENVSSSSKRKNLHTLSNIEFIQQFEATALHFAKSNNVNINDAWEALLHQALPSDKQAWAEQALFNKGMKWITAKSAYFSEFPDYTANNIKMTRKMDQVITGSTVVAPSSAQDGYSSKSSSKPSIKPSSKSNSKSNSLKQQRETRFAEHLLSLEMRLHDNIQQYNRKFLRYARSASMQINDGQLVRRYINSLNPSPKYLINNYIKSHPSNHLEQVMRTVESLMTKVSASSSSSSSGSSKPVVDYSSLPHFSHTCPRVGAHIS